MGLEGGLHPDVLLRGHVVRGHEHVLDLRRHLIEVDVALIRNAAHQLVAVPALLAGPLHEVGIHIRHERPGLIPHERHREVGLDAAGAAGDDGDRTGRRHGRHVAVPKRPKRPYSIATLVTRACLIRPPDRSLPLCKGPAGFRESLRFRLRLLVDEAHQLTSQLDRAPRPIRLIQLDQHVGPTHDAETDPANSLGQIIDLRQRVLVRVYHVVEEVRRRSHGRSERFPVDSPVIDERSHVDRPEVADVVRQQRLLAARIGGLVAAEAGHRVVAIRLIDEVDARLSVSPRAVDDSPEYVSRIQLAYRLTGSRAPQVVRLAALHGIHEHVRDRD